MVASSFWARQSLLATRMDPLPMTPTCLRDAPSGLAGFIGATTDNLEFFGTRGKIGSLRRTSRAPPIGPLSVLGAGCLVNPICASGEVCLPASARPLRSDISGSSVAGRPGMIICNKWPFDPRSFQEKHRMRRWFLAAIAVLAASTPVLAGEPKSRVVLETWDAAYLEGAKSGNVHVLTEELDRGGQKYFRTTVDLYLRVKRFKEVLELRFLIGNDETSEGMVMGTFMRQKVSKDEDRTIVGLIKGKQIHFLLNGQADKLLPAPWDEKVLALGRQQSILADKKVKPGEHFSYSTFEPSVNLVIPVDVKVLDYEEVAVPGTKTKQKLLRVEMTPGKLEGMTLPKLVQWVDADLKVVRQDTEIPGLGNMTLVRTTRDSAMTTGDDATLTDIGIGQLIRLSQKVLNPYQTRSSIFRITISNT